jgi:hypothetical protein
MLTNGRFKSSGFGSSGNRLVREQISKEFRTIGSKCRVGRRNLIQEFYCLGFGKWVIEFSIGLLLLHFEISYYLDWIVRFGSLV